jgi:hypothetical protein
VKQSKHSREVDHLYRKALFQIAFNEDASLKPAELESSISVALVADVFGRTAKQVASAIIRLRKRYESEQRAAS